MKQPLKENGGLPASILWTLAIVAGVSVANIYYIQPLLNMIRHELGISEFRTNLIAMVTQIGYAAGSSAGTRRRHFFVILIVFRKAHAGIDILHYL